MPTKKVVRNETVSHLYLPHRPVYRSLNCGDVWQFRDGTSLLVTYVETPDTVWFVTTEAPTMHETYWRHFWMLLEYHEAIKRHHAVWPFGCSAKDRLPVATADEAFQFLQHLLYANVPALSLDTSWMMDPDDVTLGVSI